MSLGIREEFARKQKDELIQKRIERSKMTNESRMKVTSQSYQPRISNDSAQRQRSEGCSYEPS
jgi:hypothetical protein